MHSMEGKLNTIVAQAGLVFLPKLDVWSTGLDGRTRVRELGAKHYRASGSLPQNCTQP